MKNWKKIDSDRYDLNETTRSVSISKIRNAIDTYENILKLSDLELEIINKIPHHSSVRKALEKNKSNLEDLVVELESVKVNK